MTTDKIVGQVMTWNTSICKYNHAKDTTWSNIKTTGKIWLDQIKVIPEPFEIQVRTQTPQKYAC